MHTSPRGIHVLTASLFMVGEIAGTGILAFPHSFLATSWYGLIIIISLCLMVGYVSILLGESWLILQEKYIHNSKDKIRIPYALIGQYSTGSFGYYSTNFTLILMLFGSAVVQMLVLSETISYLLKDYISVEFCWWVPIVALILLPVSLLGSPVDFAPVAYFAMCSTAVASILIVIATILEEKIATCEEPEISFRGVCLSIATILFGFGGAGVLPTIHNDMKNKLHFNYAVYGAFVAMLLQYIPVSSVVYYKFGYCTEENVLRNLSDSWLKLAIQILLMAHVFCAYLIQLNPVNLTCEDFFQIEHRFSAVRCILRTLMVAATVVTAWTIPRFDKVINLIGSFSVSMQSLVLPVIFYYFLCKFKLSLKVRVILFIIFIVSMFIATVSTIYAILDVTEADAFTTPCYLCQFHFTPNQTKERTGDIASNTSLFF